MANKIPGCRYYKGEPNNPYDPKDIKNAYWESEFEWYNFASNDESLIGDYILDFIFDFDDHMDWASTPLSLKAYLYNQYTHCGGSKSGFEDFMLNYISEP